MKPQDAGKLLGVNPPSLAGCETKDAAETVLRDWKDTVVQAAWKREVRLNHPDHATDEEDLLARTRATQRVNEARDVLREIVIFTPPPRPPVYRRNIVVTFGGHGRQGVTTASFTGSGSMPWPWKF